jgi:hypothetical protein
MPQWEFRMTEDSANVAVKIVNVDRLDGVRGDRLIFG